MFVQAYPHHGQDILKIKMPGVLNRKQSVQPIRTRRPGSGQNLLAMELDRFDYHRLNDVRNTDLMRRYDTKYLLPIDRLMPLLRLLHPDYSLLRIRDRNQFKYESTYFDTAAFSFFHMHHNGKLNRYKVRHRRYVDTNTSYLEVKHKNNKKRTVKDRVRLRSRHAVGDAVRELISRTVGNSCFPLHPSLKCCYARIALANPRIDERLTLDFNLCFEHPDGRQKKRLDHILIAELKQGRRKTYSPFVRLMNQWRHKPVSFSKYCVGCCFMHGRRIRTNRFKTTLMALEKMPRSSGVSRAALTERNKL